MKRKLNDNIEQQMERIGKLTTIKKGLECIKGSTSEDCLLELLTRINYPIVSHLTKRLTKTVILTETFCFDLLWLQLSWNKYNCSSCRSRNENNDNRSFLRSRKMARENSVRRQTTRENHRQKAVRFLLARYHATCSKMKFSPFSNESDRYTKFVSWWTSMVETEASVLLCLPKNYMHEWQFKS